MQVSRAKAEIDAHFARSRSHHTQRPPAAGGTIVWDAGPARIGCCGVQVVAKCGNLQRFAHRPWWFAIRAPDVGGRGD